MRAEMWLQRREGAQFHFQFKHHNLVGATNAIKSWLPSSWTFPGSHARSWIQRFSNIRKWFKACWQRGLGALVEKSPFFPNKNPAVLRPSCFFWPDCEWRNNCLGVLLQTWENFPAVWRCKLLSWWLWQNVQSLDTLHQGFFGFETFGLLVACPGSIGFTPNNFWNKGFLTHWAHLLYLLLVSSWLTGTWWKVKDMSFKVPVFAFHLW